MNDLEFIFSFYLPDKKGKSRSFYVSPEGKGIKRLAQGYLNHKSAVLNHFPVFNLPGEVPPGKSIRHMRQFHSHHNLLSLSQPSSSSPSSSTTRLHGQDPDTQDRRGPLGSALNFTLGGGGSGSCSSLTGSTESSIWVRQTPQEESKPSPAANFWDFFTGKGSSSETMV